MKKTLLLAAAAFAFASPALAVVDVTGQQGENDTPGDLTVFEDFENDTVDNSTVFADRVPGVAERPDGSTGNFGAVQGGTSQLFTFARPVSRFGFLAGSVDVYNSVIVNFASGPSQTITGAGSEGANAFFTFRNRPNDPRITGFTLASGQNSFEFDNLAVGGVPEPMTWSMMILGFGVVGGAIRRRRSVSTAVRFA